MIRDATPNDAVACSAIYAPYVADTAITFETEAPGPDEMRGRIAAAHAWVVALDADRVVGYAYGGPHKTRAAYRWSCEVSVYLEPGLRRTGLHRALGVRAGRRVPAHRLEARGVARRGVGATVDRGSVPGARIVP